MIYLIQNKIRVLFIGVGKKLASGAGRTGVFLESVSFSDELVFLGQNHKRHSCNCLEENMPGEPGGALDEANMRERLLWVLRGPEVAFPGESDSLMAQIVHTRKRTDLLPRN